MQITNSKILHKIIEVQSCIIQGKDLKVILRKNKSFYIDHTQCDAITICMNEDEKVHPEYIIEDHRVFAPLLKKYIFSNKSLAWDTFVKNHYKKLTKGKEYYQTDDFYDIFQGLITKKEAKKFNNEIGTHNSILMPLYNHKYSNKIGYVCFLFSKKKDINIKSLEEIQALFQTLFLPLYDAQYSIMYTTCAKVDKKLSLLTDQEKRITKKVLKGKSYVDIAEILNISINTLKTHMKNIFSKYNVNSKIELYNKLKVQKK